MAVSKIAEYITHRTSGLLPIPAAQAAGYSPSGITVVTARLESREDVRQAIRLAKRKGATKPVGKRGRGNDTEAPRHGNGPLDPWKLKDHYSSSLDLMIDVMNNPKAPGGLRIECAKTILPYQHARKEGGKIDEGKRRAKEVGDKPKFGTMPTPLRRAA